MMDKFKQFENQQYLNLETFRKNRQGVKTPVWFVRDENTLLVWTQAGSGKVKRIRRDGLIRVTPSDAAGAPLGEWVNAYASADDSTETIQFTERLMRKKYGLLFNMFRGLGKIRGAKNAILKIEMM
jgi:PPOX class probable F420-dependent enzyme